MTLSKTAVVIGTGVGGLTAAAYLGKLGFTVLALEQAEAPGGLLLPHQYGDYRFSWAVHYVGQCRRGQMLYNALAELDLDAEELFCEMDPDGFDIYRFPDFEVRLGRSLDAFRDRLAVLFPDQVRGLDHYFGAVRALHEVVAELDRISEHGVRMFDLKSIAKIPGLTRWMRHSYGFP
jgi:all-trans-retinol 13,14-reductase